MDFQAGKELLLDFTGEGDKDATLSALEAMSEHVRTNPISTEAFEDVARALVDKVAPALASWPQEESERGSRFFDSILINGNASAFWEMSSAVTTRTDGAEVIARSLIIFVDRRLGGVERMRAVLSMADVGDQAAAVVHLPSRILNVLYAESDSKFDGSDFLREKEYFDVLSEAVYLQPLTPDIQRDQALSDILGRMIRMKQADTMISRWLAKLNTDKISNTILRIPQSCIATAVRALLNVQTHSAAAGACVKEVLRMVLQESQIACEACISRIPFERPSLKRPRTALKRLTKGVDQGGGESALKRALHTAAEKWSSEDFSLFADAQMQQQVTRLLLYYMHLTAGIDECKQISGDDSVMMVLVEGVHLRLGQNDMRIRRHGMVVGEASSRHCEEENPLSFNREQMSDARKEAERSVGDERFEDGGDSDFTELAYSVGKELSDEEIVNLSTPDEHVVDISTAQNVEGMAEETASEVRSGNGSIAEKECSRRRRRSLIVKEEEERWWKDGDGIEHAWTHDDDWSSIESYEVTDSSGDETEESAKARKSQERDYEAVREKIAAPMSVARLLGLLREVNKSSSGGLAVDADTTAATLRTVASRAEKAFLQRGTTVHAAGPDLLLEVVGVDAQRFPDNFVEEIKDARRKAMQKLLEMDVVGCGNMLVERIICGPHSDVGKRSECLGMLSAGVRGAKERAKEVVRKQKEAMEKKEAEREAMANARRIGTVTRRMRRTKWGIGEGIVEMKPWDDEGLEGVFNGLALRLAGGGGAEFVQLDGRDSQLWAQGIVTLAVIGSMGGVSEEAGRMRGDVVEIVVGRILTSDAEGDAVVRRGCALALGAVVEAMTDAEIRGRVVVGIGGDGEMSSTAVKRAAEWLEQAVRGDSDVGVRRFAARALRIWADRVERIG